MKGGAMIDRSWMEKKRRDQKITMQQVADAAGINVSTYCRIENGFLEPGVKIALRICDFLHADVRMFLREEPIV